MFVCPSLAGAGVERRVCTLLEHLISENIAVRLGLLRMEGEFLDRVPASRLIFAASNQSSKRVLLKLFRSRDLVNSLVAIAQIRTMLREFEPDIVVTFTLESTIPMYFVVRSGQGGEVAWIISEDSNTAVASNGICGSALLGRIVQTLLGRIYRKSSHVSCVSTSVVNSVRAIYRVDRFRLGRISNPVDIEIVENAIRNGRNSFVDRDYILAVGRLVRIKQFDLLIRAFAEVRKSHRVQLLILGEGPERRNLNELIDGYGLQNDVLLPGFVQNPWNYMAQSKLLVLTSKHEGFGNVIVEAMAVGCPVVATRCGGPEDLIRHEENGLLVGQDRQEVADAIRFLLDDPEAAQRLADQARVDVEQYTPDKITRKFVALLEQVADQLGR